MTLFRIVFLSLSLSALAATSYVAWYGLGGSSGEETRSIRQGSNGAGSIAGRIK
ncbi:hypothetical protein [Sagittula sp. S175]|uniref:hypothetical protein n=1 Tax=Sagittula sp. S175 TaxID=3415129 RepID=UPI003C7E5568